MWPGTEDKEMRVFTRQSEELLQGCIYNGDLICMMPTGQRWYVPLRTCCNNRERKPALIITFAVEKRWFCAELELLYQPFSSLQSSYNNHSPLADLLQGLITTDRVYR